MIDRGFAVASEDTYIIKDTHNYSKLCLIHLVMKKDGLGKLSVTLCALDNSETLEFNLPEDFSLEPSSRYENLFVINGCNCLDQVCIYQHNWRQS